MDNGFRAQFIRLIRVERLLVHAAPASASTCLPIERSRPDPMAADACETRARRSGRGGRVTMGINPTPAKAAWPAGKFSRKEVQAGQMTLRRTRLARVGTGPKCPSWIAPLGSAFAGGIKEGMT